jgi:SecD/SecF fusion protein
MQLKGLVKFFTVALILVSLYQLSFTFAVRNVEKEAMAKATKQAKAMNPAASEAELKLLIESRYEAITDSLQGKKVVNMIFKKYTYQEAKSQELNLGLDLQGGMNVALDVSLDDFVRAQSNNPQDPALNKAIEDANRIKANSGNDFITLFGQAYEKNNPGGKLAYLFIKPNDKEVTLQSPNDVILKRLRNEGKEAINSTYNIIQKRIDKFGVSQPNVTLDNNKGVITVELAGVRNPDRVREFLQSTAKLQFWEMYNDQNLITALQEADEIVAESMGMVPAKKAASDTAKVAADTTAVAAVSGADTAKKGSDTSLASLMNDKGNTATGAKDTGVAANKPLMSLLSEQPDKDSYDPAAFAYIRRSNIETLNKYLALEDVKNVMPATARIMVGAEQGDARFDPNAILGVYAVKTQSDGSAKLEGDQISDAYFDYDNGRPVVKMDMKTEGSEIWKKMTGDNVGKFVAVALDDRIYSAPRVENEIAGGSTQITVGNDPQQAQDLANILKIGKLPAPAHIVQEQVVGPTLGAENIRAGMNSLIIAFITIFVLMLVYYNTSGMVANIALILNILFTVGILAALHATLTMPGIAGLVLTIGMAVDTNVIIFERIKEELAGGKSYTQAVADGYKRSYAPVLDGHITQLLTAIILFVFGLGPVKGFATTQIIGLLLSLFCGILVSRLITDIWTKRERHFKYFTGLSKSIFRKAHFRFIEKRKITYMISGFIFLLGIGSLINGYDYGVEFAGGRSYDIRLQGKHTATEIRDGLKPYFGEYPIVKTIGTDNTYNITTSYLISDPSKTATEKVRTKLYEGLKGMRYIPENITADDFRTQYLGGNGMERTVLPIISADLKRGAIYATALSLLAIFLYILLRFRKWQYSLGTIIALLHDVSITLAVFSFLRGRVPFALEIDQHFIAAVLTVIGFSMNDTVIVFDRVREYFRKSPGEDKKSVINRAINDTLSRTIMTSLTVFLTVLILFIFGGEATRGFAFAMLIGVLTGTYSSIFVAAPILVDMDKSDALKQEVDREARIEELKKLA